MYLLNFLFSLVLQTVNFSNHNFDGSQQENIMDIFLLLIK